MKKLLSLLLVLFISISALASCSVVEGILGSSDSSSGGHRPDVYRYNDFTNEEKEILTEYVGEVIPFVPCNKYYFVHANLENIIYRHEIEFVTMATETKQPEYSHMRWFLKEH